jgi:hypothetical protein
VQTATPENQEPSALIDCAALLKRGFIGSRPTLHRALARPACDNPFPRPLRDTRTGRRFWRVEDVESWMRREAERRETALQPDGDPARWAPKRRSARSTGLL